MRNQVIDDLIKRYGDPDHLPKDVDELHKIIHLLAFHVRRTREETAHLKRLASLMNAPGQKDHTKSIANQSAVRIEST